MAQLTLFAADSHASLGVLPGSAEARRMTATSGQRCLEWYAKPGPVGLLAKMLLGSSEWASMQCLLTWKPKATPCNRLLFQLAASVRNTDGIGFGLLPTPTVNGNHNRKGLSEKSGDGLSTAIKNLLPTPTALDHKDSSFPPGLGVTFRTHCQSLCKTLKENGAAGRLNPEFVEVLMGYPRGWTEL